jgi:hypothetical protein
VDDHVRAQLDRCYGGRDWIVAIDVLQAATPLVGALRAHGANRVLVLTGTSGVGPAPDDVPVVQLGTSGPSLMAAIRAFERALERPGRAARAAIDAFDPGGTARVVGSLFTGHERIAGRHVHGARPAGWRLLEDKTVVDAVWDAAGVPRAPSAVVDVDRGALAAASRTLDDGAGVVWVGDNREGWHGGATGLRWVRDAGDVDAALADLRRVADRARVMPFLDGVPCSIHGIAFPGRTVALRPCEMVVLRRPGRVDLQYAGTATTWDPPPGRRDELRAVAVAVGDHLRATVGYRGLFGIDGIMTADGFRPTELNPRFGAAANLIGAAADVPLYLVHLAIVEQEPVDWRPAALAADLVGAADATRAARSFVPVPEPLPEAEVGLAWRDGELRPSAEDQPADVTVRAGPGPVGGAVMVQVAAARHPVGRSAAPAVAAALRWADTAWGLGLGPLEPAPDVLVAGS